MSGESDCRAADDMATHIFNSVSPTIHRQLLLLDQVVENRGASCVSCMSLLVGKLAVMALVVAEEAAIAGREDIVCDQAAASMKAMIDEAAQSLKKRRASDQGTAPEPTGSLLAKVLGR